MSKAQYRKGIYVNPELSKQRQKQVLSSLVEYGYITEDDAQVIMAMREIK